MKKLILLFSLSFLASLASAATVSLTWQDNSENEDGFAMEARQSDGQWVEIARTETDVNELLVDSSTHEAWRVRAFNAWGYSGYTNELSKDLPNAPGVLQVKKQTVTEQITRTTTTEYETK